jgi:hypothetical protein
MPGTQTSTGATVPPMRGPAQGDTDAVLNNQPNQKYWSDSATGDLEQRAGHSRRVAALICVIGVLLTALSSWAAARVDDKAEQRLLQVQTKQAAAVLSTAILLIEGPLRTALSVQRVAGLKDTTAFERFMAGSVRTSHSCRRRSGIAARIT